MPVAELQRRMSSTEFSEWQAFERLSPGEPERTDFLFGWLAWVVYAFSPSHKRGRRYKLEDFMVKFGGAAADTDTRRQSPTEARMRLKMFFKALAKSGKVKVIDKRGQKDDKNTG